MTLFSSNGTRVPAAIEKMARRGGLGRMDRREFLAMASALGASTALAYGIAGMAAPTPAIAQESKKGGTLRVAMAVKAQKDPRTYDWVELGNMRAHGSNRWSAIPVNSPLSPSFWKAGKSTMTLPSTR